MRAYFNKRNVEITSPTANMRGRLLVIEEDDTLIARLWLQNGEVAAELTAVNRFDIGSRGAAAWTLSGVDDGGNVVEWYVRAADCGCKGG